MADSDRRLGPNAVAVLVLIALGAAVLLWQRPWQGAGDNTPAGIPADAPTRLSSQFRALSEAESESAFVAAAGTTDAAKALARQTWQSREALDATAVELRYVSGGDVTDRADGSALAVVDVSWRAGEATGLDASTVHMSSVAFRVAPQADGRFSIIGATSRDGVLPIWLAGAVTTKQSSGAVVIRVDGGDEELPVESMAMEARTAVGRTVPGRQGDLTIVSPNTQEQMAQLVGQASAKIAQIAAVTTRLDGRGGSSADTVIVLNPAVFATMDRRAAQVVLSHEATHLLTDAVGTRAESWVVEGFADFVALRDDSAPLSVSAGQILAEVRADKLPVRLPSESEFGAGRHGLGAVYESAWMVFRMLGERHDVADVVDFYTSVIGGTSLEKALQTSFGLSVEELTSDWRAYLSKSASTVS
ncbi:hypothetical protein [Aeromicrobium sp.]|uniref:hypothetical protein n=1 Tax=Aeromicrobium sp. TaxID=1871063 RepID=UPI0030BAE101